MPQPLLGWGRSSVVFPFSPHPSASVSSHKSLRSLDRSHASRTRLHIGLPFPQGRRESLVRDPGREVSGGITFQAAPGLAASQVLSAKQEGTHSREARSPAGRKGPGKQGPRRAPGAAAHLETSHARGRTPVSLVTGSEAEMPPCLTHSRWTRPM